MQGPFQLVSTAVSHALDPPEHSLLSVYPHSVPPAILSYCPIEAKLTTSSSLQMTHLQFLHWMLVDGVNVRY